jgi:hypothetical protein
MSEQTIATLVFSTEYMKQLNSVAAVTTENLVYLKRKFVSKSGWELIKYPLTECRGIEYKQDRPITKMVFAFLLLALITFIVVMVGVYWDDLDASAKVPIGALAFAGIFGARVAFGGRRHSLSFAMVDGSTLTWRSKAGEHKLMADVVAKVLEFARSKALLV